MIQGIVVSCIPAQSGKSHKLELDTGKAYTLSNKHFGTLIPQLQAGASVELEPEAWSPPDNPERVIWMAQRGSLRIKAPGTPQAAAQASITADPGITPASLLSCLTGVLKSAIEAGVIKEPTDLGVWASYAKQALLHPDSPSKPIPKEAKLVNDFDDDIPFD